MEKNCNCSIVPDIPERRVPKQPKKMRLQIKYKSAAEWAVSTYVAAIGEPLFDTDNQILKIGDGTKTWNNLPEISGNSNEDTVILNNDLWSDTNIGHITASPQSPTKVASAGDTLKKVFNKVFGTITETQPTITSQPSISISLSNYGGGTQEYGASISSIGYTINTSKGSYSYAPSNTGVTWSNYSISGGGASGSTKSGTLSLSTAYRVGISSSITFSASADNSQGAIAKTNLGNDSNPVVRISAGTKTASKTFSVNPQWFTYTKVTNDSTTPATVTGATKQTSSSYDITVGDNQYIWFYTKDAKTKIQQYAAGQWNDMTTTSAGTVTITLSTGATYTYYAYRTDKMASSTLQLQII